MWRSSPELAAAFHTHHTVVTWRVEALVDGQPADALDGVAVEGWTVTAEPGMAGRTLDGLELIDVEGRINPPTTGGPVTPYGQELRLWAGAHVGSGAARRVEWVPVGTFAVSTFTSVRTAQGIAITVTGVDRGQYAADRRPAEPVQVLRGTPLPVAIENLLRPAMPWATFRMPATSAAASSMILDALDNRVEAAEKLAEAHGFELYVDPMGDVTMVAAVDLDEPELTLRTGRLADPETEAVILQDGQRSLDPEDTYSAVVVRGESVEAAPISVVVRDEDPASPTWWRGPFGDKPFGYSSPLLSDEEQARAAARTILARKAGLSERVGVTTLLDPRLSPGDAVHLRDLEQGIDAVHRLASVRFSSRVDQPMSLETRVRRVVRL